MGDVRLDFVELWNWSKVEDQKISHILTSLLELVSLDIYRDLRDVLANWTKILEDVTTDSFDEGKWVLEDFSPCSDSSDIILHRLASGKVLWKLRDNLSHDLDTGEDVREVLLFEVIYGFHHFLTKDWAILKTGINLLEVVLVDDSLDESTNELSNQLWVDWKIW